MNPEEDFLSVEEHYNRLVQGLSRDQQRQHWDCRNVRVETGFRGRTFYVYKIEGREPTVLDTLVMEDFIINDEDGASTELRSNVTGKSVVVGFTPVKLFDHPIYLCLPLHLRVRWDAKGNDPSKPSLGFPLVIRTQSRRHLRERGVTYFETGVVYANEFLQKSAA